MLKPITLLYILIFTFLTVSCKNESENTKTSEAGNSATEITQTLVKRAAKKDLTPEEIAMLKSLMSRIMTDSQLKRFASYIVTAGLANQLSNEEGPFTIFAPSNTALESLSAEKKKLYANPENLLELEEMLKSHIVVGKFDKKTLIRDIDKNGQAKLKTLAGNTLMASKSGGSIIITNVKKEKATVLNNGTEASNGVVYVVNDVLSAN